MLVLRIGMVWARKGWPGRGEGRTHHPCGKREKEREKKELAWEIRNSQHKW